MLDIIFPWWHFSSVLVVTPDEFLLLERVEHIWNSFQMCWQNLFCEARGFPVAYFHQQRHHSGGSRATSREIGLSAHLAIVFFLAHWDAQVAVARCVHAATACGQRPARPAHDDQPRCLEGWGGQRQAYTGLSYLAATAVHALGSGPRVPYQSCCARDTVTFAKILFIIIIAA